MDVPGTENSETVPTNSFWVKAGLLSFWSSTTISMVVGFSSLSPLGDSAKAFSYTHTNRDTTDKCFLIKMHSWDCFLHLITNESHAFHDGNIRQATQGECGYLWYLYNNICLKWQKEMCRMFGSTSWVTSQSSGPKHSEVSPKMPIKALRNWPLSVCTGVWDTDICFKTKTWTYALKTRCVRSH